MFLNRRIILLFYFIVLFHVLHNLVISLYFYIELNYNIVFIDEKLKILHISDRLLWLQLKLECGPMPNVMGAMPNIGGALCSTPQFV